MSARKWSSGSAGQSHWTKFAVEKLAKLLGEEKGEALFDELLGEIGKQSLASADDLLVFSQAMAKRGGFVEAMSVVLQTYSILKRTGG